MFRAKMLIQPNGSSLGIALKGTEQDIQDAYYTLFNWGAVNPTDGELEYNHNRCFAYCTTNPERLKKGLQNIWENRIISFIEKTGKQKYKRAKGRPIRTLAAKLSERTIKRLQHSNFLPEYDENI